jgi:TetR/AcrR family transcriptional regulator, fatty acid metabolism regulator protein
VGVAKVRAPRSSARRTARLAVRSDLHAAAEAVFAEKGFAATKMTDIAQRAGVAVGTLYNYFTSKEEIFQEICVTRSGQFMAALEPAQRAGTPIEQLGRIVRETFAHLDQHSAMFALLIERGAHGEYDLERIGGPVVDREYVRFLGLLDKTIRKAVAAGQLRRDVPVPTMVAALSGAMNGATYAWLKRRRRGRLAAVADDIITLFLSGARVRS